MAFISIRFKVCIQISIINLSELQRLSVVGVNVRLPIAGQFASLFDFNCLWP